VYVALGHHSKLYDKNQRLVVPQDFLEQLFIETTDMRAEKKREF